MGGEDNGEGTVEGRVHEGGLEGSWCVWRRIGQGTEGGGGRSAVSYAYGIVKAGDIALLGYEGDGHLAW